MCDRCKKGYHYCLGYDESRIFVNQTLEPSSASKRTDISEYDEVEKTKALTKTSPTMPLTAFKDDIVISYLMAKFHITMEPQLPTIAHAHTDTPTLAAVLCDKNMTSSAYISGLCLSEALFARMHNLNDMAAHSVELYGQALSQLQQDLRNAKNGCAHVGRRPYGSLWSSLLLGLYEMVSSAIPQNWLEHVRGAAALVSLVINLPVWLK